MAWLGSQINPEDSQNTVKSGTQYLDILQPEICYGSDFGMFLLGTRLQRYSGLRIVKPTFIPLSETCIGAPQLHNWYTTERSQYTTTGTQLRDPNTQLLVCNWSSSSKVLFICNLGVKWPAVVKPQ